MEIYASKLYQKVFRGNISKDTYLKAMLSLFDELNISITDNIQKEFTIKVNDIKYTIFIYRRMCDE